MPVDPSIARALCVALVAVSASACTAPRRIEYEPGTFRFDWSREPQIEEESRRRFRDRFDRNLAALTVELQDQSVVDAVRASNERDRQRTVAELMELDEAWKRENGDELASSLVDEDCSRSLRRLQQTFEGFAEIFVTNDRGVNVCQSHKTTDYYQADEEWWTKTWEFGSPWHDSLSYDESAGVIGVSIYMTVLDPDTGAQIGVCKAVVEEKPPPVRF